ncbi:MAG: beta-ketoacyl synthase chain length factor [Deltaproteobacteria bacterium]|nr:beta-ketoacyl synthase chain length factor [Deltaproteobacteria bacterium]
MNDFYINGAGVISPQKTYDDQTFLSEITEYADNVLTCVLPNFKDYIHPFQLRRLSRMLRIGLAAAVICLRQAQVQTPDAIITSTGSGFQDDTAKFLSEILTQDEQQLTPTFFMQSTYNAMAGLIALSVRCRGYNNTHVGRGFAFESALDDAMMLLHERNAQNVLVGSFDEVSPVQYNQYARMGYFKKESVCNLDLFDTQTSGTLQGEGTAFFVLSSAPEPHTLCRLRNVRMVYKPTDYRELANALDDYLSQNQLEHADIDVFINGISGDNARDHWNMAIRQDRMKSATEVRFKHLTGEYATASSFALWLGAMILKTQQIPDAVLVKPAVLPATMNTVLICNHFLSRNYSFMLLERATTSC